MKNNILRLLSAVLSLALLPACLLCACKPGSNGGDTTPAEESTGTPEPRLLTVVDKGEAKLEIVRPEEKTSGIMTRFGQALRTKLGNYFQTYFTLSEDWYNENLSGVTPPKERYEILIGATNRAESKAAISELAAGEYIIRVTDRKVVIAGYDNNALAVALRYFFVEMCKYSDYSDSETNSLAFPIGLEVKKSAGASDLKSIIRSGSDLTGELVSRVFKSSGGQYQYAQGGACDGEYIYLVYMKNDVGVIKKVRMSDWTLVATSEQINTGHGNDMTYDANNNRLVLVNMADNMITFISPETLGVIGTKKLNYPSYAIAYNTSTGGYAIASGGEILITNDKFEVSNRIPIRDFGFVGQGMDADANFIYLPQSAQSGVKNKTNIIQVYGWDGQYITNVTVYTSIESETVFHSGNDSLDVGSGAVHVRIVLCIVLPGHELKELQRGFGVGAGGADAQAQVVLVADAHMAAGLGGQREGEELEIGVQRLHGRNDPDALNDHGRFAVGESVQRLVVVGAHGVFLSVAVQLQEFLGGLLKTGIVDHSGFAVVDGAVDGLIIVHAVQRDHGPHRAGLPVHVMHHEGGNTGGLQLFAHGDQFFIGGGDFNAVFFENLLVIENAGGVHGDGQAGCRTCLRTGYPSASLRRWWRKHPYRSDPAAYRSWPFPDNGDQWRSRSAFRVACW